MRRIILLASAVLAASPALAQNRESRSPSTNPGSFGGVSSGMDGQRILNGFADCAVVKHRPLVERYLAEPPESRGASFRAKRLEGTPCNTSLLLLAADNQIRGALYEALFLVDFRAAPPMELRNAPPMAYGAPAAGASDWARTSSALLKYSDCIVRNDGAGVRAILSAEVGTAREVEAFRAVGASFSRCLAEGQQIKFSRPLLRGFLAEALYRLSFLAAGKPALTANR
jgi:hypothetical protein